MSDLHQQIADTEDEIDTLSNAAEQCLKSMVVPKAAIGLGVLLFVASLLVLIRSDAIVLAIGIASSPAGTVFFGSSRSSLDEIAEKTRACEAHRAEMSDGMDLRTVEDR
jgi:hypothetical protein